MYKISLVPRSFAAAIHHDKDKVIVIDNADAGSWVISLDGMVPKVRVFEISTPLLARWASPSQLR